MSKVVVTGYTGFVGKNLMQSLVNDSYDVYGLNSSGCDLRDPIATENLFKSIRPDCIIHLAALCGGIGANKANPGKFMNTNLQIGMNTVNAALHAGVKKFINVGTICAYPKFAPIPFKEEDMWNGYPEETNAPYGIAKRAITELLMAYERQYGFHSVNLYPTNMYGPFDNFDPASSHVIPAIILKVYNAMCKGEGKILLWGTGAATRDFLYVDDFCQVIRLALDINPGSEPINIGTEAEYSIYETTEIICELMGFKGEVVWDDSQPDGQPRRCVDSSRATARLGYELTTNLRTGLKQTIEWFIRGKKKGVL